MSRDTVVIAGGGPTGLMLAGELRLAGIEAVVLERAWEPPAWSRAQTFQVRSVEIFRQRGMTWFEGYGKVRTYNFGLLELMGAIDPGLVPPRVPQRHVELRLEEHARALGTDLRRGHELVGFAQDDEGVTVDVRGPDGGYQVRGAYLVGCDGGRSTVRKLAGITFDGGPSVFTFTGLTGDLVLKTPPPDEYLVGPDLYRIGPGIYPLGVFLLLPQVPENPGVHRFTVMHFGAQSPPADQPVSPREVEAAIRAVAGVELEIGDYHLLSRFGGATLLARDYRKGRVFLAGDSAHVHMPFGGQGLNTGVQDAVNLGWKLAAVIRGWAPAGLLETYHAERHPVGHQVCENTKAQVGMLYPLRRLAPLLDLMRELLKFDRVSNHIFEMISAVGLKYPVGYPDGPDGPRDHPLLGRRLPHVSLSTPTGTGNLAEFIHRAALRGLLIDFTPDGSAATASAGWADRLEVLTAEPTPDVDAAVVLLRPDGYVAWADASGRDAEGLRLALETWFGAPVAAVAGTA